VATQQTARTRAKDSDRTTTCQVLDSALADGQLSMEEHRTRVASATNAATLGDLQTLVDDLQNENAPVRMPNLKEPSRLITSAGRGGWGMRAAVAGVLILFGIGIGWGLYGNTSSPLSFETQRDAIDPGAQPDGIPAKVLDAPRELLSLGGLKGLFEQMTKKFGDTNGFGIRIFSDYASLERPDPTESRRTLSYPYRGGWGDPSETSRSDSGPPVNLLQFDIPTLVGVIRGAPQTLGFKPDDVKDVNVSIKPSNDITAPPGAIEIEIYVSPKFGGSGFIQLNGDATIKRVSPPSS
jgi:hypothetical protein